MSYTLHKDFIAEMMETYKAKFLDTDAAIDKWSKRLQALTSFVAHMIATFVRLKVQKRIGSEKYITAFASKEPISNAEIFSDGNESLPQH